MADHLDQYVADFIDQFEVMHDDVKFGDEIKDGSYRYPFSLDHLKQLEKFLHYRNMTLVNAGHMWTGQDIHVIDTVFNTGIVVVLSYNEVQEILTFMPHAYFYMEKGQFYPFSTYEGAYRFSKKRDMISMMHELS